MDAAWTMPLAEFTCSLNSNKLNATFVPDSPVDSLFAAIAVSPVKRTCPNTSETSSERNLPLHPPESVCADVVNPQCDMEHDNLEAVGLIRMDGDGLSEDLDGVAQDTLDLRAPEASSDVDIQREGTEIQEDGHEVPAQPSHDNDPKSDTEKLEAVPTSMALQAMNTSLESETEGSTSPHAKQEEYVQQIEEDCEQLGHDDDNMSDIDMLETASSVASQELDTSLEWDKEEWTGSDIEQEEFMQPSQEGFEQLGHDNDSMSDTDMLETIANSVALQALDTFLEWDTEEWTGPDTQQELNSVQSDDLRGDAYSTVEASEQYSVPEELHLQQSDFHMVTTLPVNVDPTRDPSIGQEDSGTAVTTDPVAEDNSPNCAAPVSVPQSMSTSDPDKYSALMEQNFHGASAPTVVLDMEPRVGGLAAQNPDVTSEGTNQIRDVSPGWTIDTPTTDRTNEISDDIAQGSETWDETDTTKWIGKAFANSEWADNATEPTVPLQQLLKNQVTRNIQAGETVSILSPYAEPFMPRAASLPVIPSVIDLLEPWKPSQVWNSQIFTSLRLKYRSEMDRDISAKFGNLIAGCYEERPLEGSQFQHVQDRFNTASADSFSCPFFGTGQRPNVLPIGHERARAPAGSPPDDEEEVQDLKFVLPHLASIFCKPEVDPIHRTWSTDSGTPTDGGEEGGQQPHAGCPESHHSDGSSSDAFSTGNEESSEAEETIQDEDTPEKSIDWNDPSLLTSKEFAGVWGDKNRQVETSSAKTEQNVTGQLTRLSADSGFGSLSDHSRVSDSSATSSPTGRMFCRQHGRPVTLFCTETYERLCSSCHSEHHLHCGSRVVDISTACHDLRCKLLKVQGHLDGLKSSLTGQANDLKSELEKLGERRHDADAAADLVFKELIRNMHELHQLRVKRLTAVFTEVEEGLVHKGQQQQRTLALLGDLSHFLHVLRQQDSRLDLLSRFDSKLGHLLEKVLDTTEDRRSKVLDLRELAVNVFRPCTSQTSANGLDSQSEQDFRTRLNAEDAAPAEDWHIRLFQEHATGSIDEEHLGSGDGCSHSHIEKVMQQLDRYLHNRAPELDVKNAQAPSLYTSVMDNFNGLATSPGDFLDDVFLYEPKPGDTPSDVFTRRVGSYKQRQKIAVYFPQDTQPAYVTDLHVTETGVLVFLDAANNALKRCHPNKAARGPTWRLSMAIPQPLSLCSAGWNRVMVSCGGRLLKVINAGIEEQLQLVTQHSTQHQYRGLVRASDALVAAACPETGSVDLLDLAGQVTVRVLHPCDFITGPEVVGVTKNWELLVVSHPLNCPTAIVCFDMSGKQLWTCPLPKATRHMSCCKVVGGEDGYVYVAVTGDSVLYRVDPATSRCDMVLGFPNISLPSSLAVTFQGEVIVTNNDLPNVEPTAIASNMGPMLPTTTEIAILSCDQPEKAV